METYSNVAGGGDGLQNDRVIEKIKNGLIVSCQALDDEAMYSKTGGVMPLFAIAAQRAGACGIRANSVRDIMEIKEVIDLPIIGIIKKVYPDSCVFISATMEEIDSLVKAGVEIVALDATLRKRPDGSIINEFFQEVRKKYPNQLFMADCATLEEGLNAAELGFDFIGTTLSGYTEESKDASMPNFELVKEIVKNTNVPVIAEGCIIEPTQAKKMLEIGAHSVVVGGAITRPQQIAERFVEEIKKV